MIHTDTHRNTAIAVAYYVDGLSHKEINLKFGVTKYLTEKLAEFMLNQRISDIIIDRIKERERKRKENEAGFGFYSGAFLGHKREAYHDNEDHYEGEPIFNHVILTDS